MGAQELEALNGPMPDQRAVLADAGGEHDGVDAAHDGSIGPDVLPDPVGEHVDGHLAVVIAFFRANFDVAHVVGAGEPLQARLAVYEMVHTIDVQPLSASPMQQGAHIDIATSAPHGQPLDRGHAHACLNGSAVLHGCHAGAVAQVAGDEPQISHVGAKVFGGSLGHELVTCSVKPVSAHSHGLGLVGGEGVGGRAAGQGVVKGGVEHRHVNEVGEQRSGSPDPLQVGGVVEWCQGNQRLQGGFDLIVDANGL